MEQQSKRGCRHRGGPSRSPRSGATWRLADRSRLWIMWLTVQFSALGPWSVALGPSWVSPRPTRRSGPPPCFSQTTWWRCRSQTLGVLSPPPGGLDHAGLKEQYPSPVEPDRRRRCPRHDLGVGRVLVPASSFRFCPGTIGSSRRSFPDGWSPAEDLLRGARRARPRGRAARPGCRSATHGARRRRTRTCAP